MAKTEGPEEGEGIEGLLRILNILLLVMLLGVDLMIMVWIAVSFWEG